MKSYSWSHLNKQQVGAYAEYYVKMQLTLYGFQVYGTEIDDRGIDFVARHGRSRFLEFQVKSTRTAEYIFMQKKKFPLCDDLYLALVAFTEAKEPELYFIPSTRWMIPDKVFVSRDYIGLKSIPEWGLNLSKKNYPALESYRLERVVEELKK